MKVRKILLFLLMLSPLLMSDCCEPTASESYFQQLEAMKAAGEMPDMGFVDAYRAPRLMANGWLSPIPAEYAVDDFDPHLLEYFQRGGETYALPHNVQPWALVINLDLFEEYGVQPPEDPEDYTWDDLRAMAEALTDPNQDLYGLGLGAGFSTFLPYLFQGGGRLLDESGTEMAIVSTEATEALTFYANLHADALVYPPTGEWPLFGVYDALPEAFVNGKVAMFQTTPGAYGTVLRLIGPDTEAGPRIKVVELPKSRTGNKATSGSVRGFGLYTEPSEAALGLLEYATSEEGMSFWIGDLSSPPDLIPARRSAREKWLEARPDTKAFVDAVDYMQTFQPATASVGAMEEFDRFAADTLSKVLSEEITVDEGLQLLEDKGNDLLQGQ
jgi:multiple sugar transport system substrate-binding protein